jgi:hypothetical protein
VRRWQQVVLNVFAMDVSLAMRDSALRWFPGKNEFTGQQILVQGL